ncbi:MAG: metallopeptidase TldD-related protein, partial [Bacillota bacterium]|nr:metallopeptidase TldD-related protein [Bacillota bacterium]
MEKKNMMDKIIGILKGKSEISAWTISESEDTSVELFFIREKMDMNRMTNTHEFSVRIYVDFTEDHVQYKGHSSCVIGISDSLEEIENKIDSAVFSAKFVKNKWYDLPANPSNEYTKNRKFSNIDDLKDQFPVVHKIIYDDYGTRSKVNSCEIFAVEGTRRTVTSKGTDISYPYSEFTFEVVTDCNQGNEPVEIFNGYYLTHIDHEQIRTIIKKQLSETEGRSVAVRNPKLTNQRLILSGDAVEDFLFYYISQASDYYIYTGVSHAKRGENFQKEDAKEKLNLTLNPTLDCSIYARPVDTEGKIMKSYNLYTDGKVTNIQTSASRYSHYLGVENMGSCSTFEVKGGDTALSDFMKEDHIEIIAFSSFNIDMETGDFGGEFRLAKQVVGGKTHYLTGG